MKILFNNVFEDASWSATNESLNYPVANLAHPFLRKRFQSTSTSSLVTASFGSDQTMSCLFYGYHNLTSLTVVFRNSGGGTLLTLNITSPEDIGVEDFTELTTVRSVEFTLNGASGFFLGGVGAGSCYMMPDPLAAYEPGNEDNSDFSESPYGQTLQNFVEPLRELEYGFRDEEGTIYKEIDALYKSVGVGKPLYIDLYEDNRDKEPPIYAKLIRALSFPYSPRRHNFTIRLREAR